MKLIISAMKIEIETILKKIEAKKIQDYLFEIYEYKKIMFVISGVGTLNANICLTYILNKYTNITEIYNFGVVGSLDIDLPVLKLIYVKGFFWFLNNEKIKKIDYLKNKGLGIKNEILLTSNFFIQHNYLDGILAHFSRHQLFSKNIVLPKIADMEFGAYYYVAKKYQKQIYSIKVVSDNINNRSNEKEYSKNMLYCKKILKRVFFEIFMKEL